MHWTPKVGETKGSGSGAFKPKHFKRIKPVFVQNISTFLAGPVGISFLYDANIAGCQNAFEQIVPGS